MYRNTISRDYEAIKGAAIDPYIAMRDAYVQYRKKLIER